MKKRKLKYLIITLITILILTIPFFNFTAFRIENYTDDFEKINDFILQNNLNEKSINEVHYRYTFTPKRHIITKREN